MFPFSSAVVINNELITYRVLISLQLMIFQTFPKHVEKQNSSILRRKRLKNTILYSKVYMYIFLQTIALLLIQNGKFSRKRKVEDLICYLSRKRGKEIACFRQHESYQADLATERERHLTTGKRAERTKLDSRCPICHSALGQASCLICARRCQLTFPFCC